MTKKKCIKCNIKKELTSFNRHPKMNDGHTGTCTDCISLYCKARRKRLSKYPWWVDRENKKRRERYHRLKTY